MTRIKSVWTTDNYINIEANGEVVDISHSNFWLVASKDDVVAAVEKELDATVILHSDLPDLHPEAAKAILLNEHGFSGTADDARQHAYTLLAVANYIEKNPPVDEAQVEALTRLVANAGLSTDDNSAAARRMARALVKQGVRVEEPK